MTFPNTLVVSRKRALATLFFIELAFSPLIAGFALLVPVIADWGAYQYLPAVIWLLILVQCLITFRWRGLWFSMGFPVAFVAIEAFLVAAPPAAKQELPSANVR